MNIHTQEYARSSRIPKSRPRNVPGAGWPTAVALPALIGGRGEPGENKAETERRGKRSIRPDERNSGAVRVLRSESLKQHVHPAIAETLGGPGGVRTHDVLSEADYESAACNQHGVRPTKLRSVATNETTMTCQQKSPVYPKAGLFDDRPTYYTKAGRPGHRARDFRALNLTRLNSLRGTT